MNNIFNQIKNNWELRYSTYIDDLILFDPNYYTYKTEEKVFKRESNDFLVGYDNEKIIYIKIENASKYFNKDLEELSKDDIIKALKEHIYA